MIDQSHHKSHSGRWIIYVMVALVIYVGSVAPIRVLFVKGKIPLSAAPVLNFIYQPAKWVWAIPGLEHLYPAWFNVWWRIIPGDMVLGPKF
jgi:hypothetical protein